MILEINNLSFSYGSHEILKNISLKLESPTVCSILGPNGIGKTSFIKCLLGLKKIKEGSILLDGKDIYKINRKEFYSFVSYVKQGGKETSIYTALDTVLLGMASHINPLLKPVIRRLVILILIDILSSVSSNAIVELTILESLAM